MMIAVDNYIMDPYTLRLAREGTNPIGSGCLLMEIATLHIANAKTGEPFREARLAMLTHRALQPHRYR